MRLIKDNNTLKYELFYDILTRNSSELINPNYGILDYQNDSKDIINYRRNQFLTNHSYILKIYNSFEKEIEKLEVPNSISNLLEDVVKKIIPIEGFSFLLFNENKSSLVSLKSIEKNNNNEFDSILEHYYNEKILDFVFEKNNPSFLPNLFDNHSNDSKLNILIFPIVEEGNSKGLLGLSTKIKIQKISESEIHLIKSLLNLSFVKIEKYFLKKMMKNIYEELQTYQAKLANDFHLSTIGELTEGIVEEILSPLQFIMSQVELYQSDISFTKDLNNLKSDQKIENLEGLEKIKEKIQNIQTVISRLVKFTESSKQKLEIYPCNINDIVAEFYSLIKSSLRNMNIECVLDLDKNIPSVLSHPNYLYQILRNSFNLIKTAIEKDGGILIQTRFRNENVELKIISTSNLIEFSKETPSEVKSSNINFRMLQNLIEKHEGKFKIDSSQKSGSTITFTLPIRRKIRV